jgi:predicted amidohydrolase
MEDIIKVTAVNFKAEYADKKANIEKMLFYIEQAAKDGSNLVVLPELCLTGYDVFCSEELTDEEKTAYCEDKMGTAVQKIRAAVERLGLYCVFGFAEKAEEACYNSAAVVSPDGNVEIYRKIHLFGREGLFFRGGNKPLLIKTPWGNMGVGICYDTYNFPELLRYYAYKGARLYLNPTAMAFENDTAEAKSSFCDYYRTTLEYNVINTGMFIVSSDLTGCDRLSKFGGGSVIMGAAASELKRPKVKYYAGAVENETEGEFTAELNLSLHNPRLFVPNPVTKRVDFMPELYANFYKQS